MKTSELTGALLDYWVARAEGLEVRLYRLGEPTSRCWTIQDGRTGHVFAPSTSWAQGGPIIERERIQWRDEGGTWCAGFGEGDDDDWLHYGEGETQLVAAMRAYVASKFGDEVQDVEGVA